jgi:hypothetical protein
LRLTALPPAATNLRFPRNVRTIAMTIFSCRTDVINYFLEWSEYSFEQGRYVLDQVQKTQFGIPEWLYYPERCDLTKVKNELYARFGSPTNLVVTPVSKPK